MSEEKRPCPQCGKQVEAGIKFCGSCGYAFSAPAESNPQSPSPSAPAPQRTVLGMPATYGLNPAAAPTSDNNRTVLGMPATPMPSAPPVAVAAAAPNTSSAPAALASANRTMLGMPLNELPGAPSTPEPAPTSNAAAAAKAHLEAQTNRTMLGVAIAPPQDGNYGGPSAAIPTQPTRARNEGGYDELEAPQPEPPTPTKKGGLLLWIGLGLVVLLLVAGSVLVLKKMKSTHAPIQASIVRIATGDALQVDVPGAPSRTKLRFSGQEMLLASGRATFPIESQALHVGDNTLQFALVAPDGSVSNETVHLAVDYRVRADISAVDNAVPSIDIVIDAHPGAQVTLDGTPLALDAQGHGVRRLPLNTALAAAGVIEVNSRYTIANNGGTPPVEGTLASRLAVTTLQIERPGRILTTDSANIEVTGLVEQDAVVTVDGVTVPVTAGRFTQRITLSDMGERTIAVVARAHGKAPQTFNIQVTRVADLNDAAARFGVDRTLTYARIAAAPNSFVGQKIALEGLVFNVTQGGGQSVVQMLVNDCPPGERCQVWVTFPAATTAQTNTNIRVIGTVGGEQQYRSQSGRANTAPRVDAAFILPLRAR
jgi:hypothetical protein